MLWLALVFLPLSFSLPLINVRVSPNTVIAGLKPAFLEVSFTTSTVGRLVAGQNVTLVSNVPIFIAAIPANNPSIALVGTGSTCTQSKVTNVPQITTTSLTVVLGPSGCVVQGSANVQSTRVTMRIPTDFINYNPVAGTRVVVTVSTSNDGPTAAPAYVTVSASQRAIEAISAIPSSLSAGTLPQVLTLIFVMNMNVTGNNILTVFVDKMIPDQATSVFSDNWSVDSSGNTVYLSGITLTSEAGDVCKASGASSATTRLLEMNLGTCVILPGLTVTLTIPSNFLVANPPKPVTVWLALAYADATSTVTVPYTTTAATTRLAALQFLYMIPDTTKLNTRPNTMFVYFVPGIQLEGGGQISIFVTKPVGQNSQGTTILNTVFGAYTAVSGQTAPTVSVGSCTTSRVEVRVRTVTTLILYLSPMGCVLPAGTLQSFAIPQQYLVAPTSQEWIWASMATNKEPYPTLVQMPYSVGTSAVRDFSVTPSTTVAGLTPSLTISVTLETALTSYYSPSFYFQAPVGVFREGAILNNVRTNIAACTAVSAYVWYSMLTITLAPAACVATAVSGAQFIFTIDAIAPTVVQPNLPAGTPIVFLVTSDDNWAAVNKTAYITTAACGTGSTLNVGYTVDSVSLLTDASRLALTTAMTDLSWTESALFQCTAVSPSVWYIKGTQPAWPIVITQTGAPTVMLTNAGLLPSLPIYLIVINYPPTAASLQALSINPLFYARATFNDYITVFVVRIDRLMVTGAMANTNNPVAFQVNVLNVSEVVVYTAAGVPGVTVSRDIGTWAQGKDYVMVWSTVSGTFVGLSQPVPSPVPSSDDGSDEALLGLLALIAVPFLLLALLAFFVWMLMRNRPAECTQPVQQYAMVPMDYVVAPVVPTPASAATSVYLEPQPYW